MGEGRVKCGIRTVELREGFRMRGFERRQKRAQFRFFASAFIARVVVESGATHELCRRHLAGGSLPLHRLLIGAGDRNDQSLGGKCGFCHCNALYMDMVIAIISNDRGRSNFEPMRWSRATSWYLPRALLDRSRVNSLAGNTGLFPAAAKLPKTSANDTLYRRTARAGETDGLSDLPEPRRHVLRLGGAARRPAVSLGEARWGLSIDELARSGAAGECAGARLARARHQAWRPRRACFRELPRMDDCRSRHHFGGRGHGAGLYDAYGRGSST